MVIQKNRPKSISYNKLLTYLHSTEFRFSVPNDINRAKDGADLRYRFALFHDLDDVPECLDGPCSVLEMLVALSIRCEENIMDNPLIGNRTAQWFWDMINNLGLGGMTDARYDRDEVVYIVERFLNRDYEPDGTGGLFTIRHCKTDLRNVEIWYQLNWYLDSIT